MDAELSQLLAALCSDDGEVRGGAEKVLAGSRQLPGFAARLVLATTAASGNALPLRQMALTVLRQLVKDHWADVALDDAAAVRRVLLESLAEESSALRGLLHACVVHVCAAGGQWPHLQERLAAGLSQGTPQQATCCVECIVALLDEGGKDVAASLGPLQAPLLRLAANDATPPALRRLCVDAHVAGVRSAVAMNINSNEAAVAAAVGSLPPWQDVHAALCGGLPAWSDMERVAGAFTAIRAMTALSRFRILGQAMAEKFEDALRPACLLVQQIEPAYAEAVIYADDAGASEEDEAGPSQLVAQLMELIQAMLPCPPLKALIKGRLRSLLQLLVPFMRVTEAQARTWREDPNEFLAHEEDERVRGCAVRLSGEYLLGELLERSKRESGKAVAELAGQLLDRGLEGQAAGDARAWRLTELGLLMLGVAMAGISVKALQRSDFGRMVPTAVSMAGRLCADPAAPDLLRARAFALLRKLGDAVCATAPSDLPALLEASAGGIDAREPLVVRVSACRSFCRFLTAVRDKALCDKLLLERGVLASLGSLMRGANDELLHLTLESLCIIVRQCPETIVTGAASLSALILEIWRKSITDPLVGLQVLDLVGCATGTDERLQRALEEGLLPAVVADLRPDAEPHVASSAVQLFGVLLKRARVPFEAPLWAGVTALLALVARSDESGLLENACDALVCLVERSPEQVLEHSLLVPLLQCVEHMLGPGLDDNACCFVGPFLTLVLSKFGKALPADVVTGLLRVVVTRLMSAQLPYLKQELLVVVARLLHEDFAGTLGALAAMRLLPSGGGEPSALEVLLVVWMANAEVVRARRARNVTVSALCRLHERCGEDEALRSLRIDGAPLPERLLAAIAAALEFENERHGRSLKAAAAVDAESDEDEDDDDGDFDVSDRRAEKLMSELIDLEDDEDDLDALLEAEGGGGDAYQALERSDPLHSLDLRKAASEYLARVAQGTGCQDEALRRRVADAVAAASAQP